MERVSASQNVSHRLQDTNRVSFCTLKRRFFGKFDPPLNGNFPGMWNHVSRATTWTCIRAKFGGNRSKESGRSGASYTWQKNNGSTHFFALCPKPIVRFRWKRARLSLFRPQPHLPSFIQIDPSFRDLFAKTTFKIVTIYAGSPIIKHKTTLQLATKVYYIYIYDKKVKIKLLQ